MHIIRSQFWKPCWSGNHFCTHNTIDIIYIFSWLDCSIVTGATALKVHKGVETCQMVRGHIQYTYILSIFACLKPENPRLYDTLNFPHFHFQLILKLQIAHRKIKLWQCLDSRINFFTSSIKCKIMLPTMLYILMVGYVFSCLKGGMPFYLPFIYELFHLAMYLKNEWNDIA